MSYDKNGNLTRVITPLGHEIRREYDLANRLMKESHIEKGGSIHNTTTFEYDKAGNMISATDLNGYSIRYQYDLLNREIRKIGKDGGITTKEYDLNGKIRKVVLPQEQKLLGEKAHGYQYCYDRLGNRTEISGPDGRRTQRNLYNQHGELVEQLDGAGSGVEFIYNYGGLRERRKKAEVPSFTNTMPEEIS